MTQRDEKMATEMRIELGASDIKDKKFQEFYIKMANEQGIDKANEFKKVLFDVDSESRSITPKKKNENTEETLAEIHSAFKTGEATRFGEQELVNNYAPRSSFDISTRNSTPKSEEALSSQPKKRNGLLGNTRFGSSWFARFLRNWSK